MSRHWGAGTFSSSDGQRFPASGKVRYATALPRYFGYGKGVTFYTWTADQFSQYGTKVIPTTVRDATYVLDEILDNETELPLLEHTTDTAGYTEIVFALFDLLGLQFSPRLRDLGDQRLFREGKSGVSWRGNPVSVSMPRCGIQEDENRLIHGGHVHACRGYFQSSSSFLPKKTN